MLRPVRGVGFLAVVLIIGCGKGTPEPPGGPAAAGPGAPTGPAPDGGQTYSPPEGDYSVTFPAGVTPPRQTSQETPTDSGPITLRQAPAKLSDGTALSVTVTKYPRALLQDASPRDLLARAAERATQTWQGQPKSSKALTVSGHPGQFLEFHPPGGDAGVRVLQAWANDSLYQVMAVGPRAAVAGEAVSRILESFKLNAAGPAGKTAEQPAPADAPSSGPVDAVALSREFKENFQAAAKRRLGKTVTVEGVVATVTPAKPGLGPSVALEGYLGAGEPAARRRPVNCAFAAKGDASGVAALKPGDRVTIRGRLSGGGPGFVQLQECTPEKGR